MGPGWCPYTSFRTSGDIINVWDRIIENLMSTTKFLSMAGKGVPPEGRALEPPIYFPPPPPNQRRPTMPLSRPGCWACEYYQPTFRFFPFLTLPVLYSLSTC